MRHPTPLYLRLTFYEWLHARLGGRPYWHRDRVAADAAECTELAAWTPRPERRSTREAA